MSATEGSLAALRGRGSAGNSFFDVRLSELLCTRFQ